MHDANMKITEQPILNLVCHKYCPYGVWGHIRQFQYGVSNKIYMHLCD